MAESVFAAARDEVWKFRFATELEMVQLAGGIPNDPEVARGWLRARVFGDQGRDIELSDMLAQTMAERGVDMETAVNEIALKVNGFKRDGGGLVVEGRIVKAMLRENFSIAAAGGHIPSGARWGATKKGLLGFVAEHVQVPHRFIPLLDLDSDRQLTPDDLEAPRQRFTTGRFGTSIKYEEVTDCRLEFTVISDWNFGDDVWAKVWLLAEENGLGSSRSQDSGKFVVTRWEQITDEPPKRRVRRK